MATNTPPRPVAPLRGTVPQELPVARLRVKNILCPIGFTEFSRRAFHYALSIARHYQARLYAQHTVPGSLLATGGGDQDASGAGVHKAVTELHRLVAWARDEQLELPEVVTLVNEGSVRDRILETIEQQEIDLLVMGTHGRKGLDRLVHGSLTERIVHEALCPVLVVSHPLHDFIAPEEIEPVRLKTFLLPTDFSPTSERALAFALHWTAEWSGKLILLHAADNNLLTEQQVAAEWQKMQRHIAATLPQQCEVSYEIRAGHPKEQILKMAEEKHADLIVMGARGLGRSAGPWGSTISNVVRDGRFPVLGVCELAV
ncbi:MAG: universal stress protein [Acidobacteria bacterium]|nr:universal stress protein [Acidobacteriota bacterium]